MRILEYIAETQLWKSVFRHPMPTDRRNRVVVMLTNFFLHLHPVSVRKQGIALSYTWCMGGTTFFLFIVETVTGVLLMFYYRPTLEHAYNDILALRDVTTLGILRELHRWGAHAMVIAVWLHMYRVFLTGSYKPPREFNWGVGVILLVLDAVALVHRLSAAVGPARDLGDHGRLEHGAGHAGIGGGRPRGLDVVLERRQADHAGARMRNSPLLGGRAVGEMTLNRFYVLHCVAIPLAAALLIMIHFWRVRKDGGISGPM